MPIAAVDGDASADKFLLLVYPTGLGTGSISPFIADFLENGDFDLNLEKNPGFDVFCLKSLGLGSDTAALFVDWGAVELTAAFAAVVTGSAAFSVFLNGFDILAVIPFIEGKAPPLCRLRLTVFLCALRRIIY